MDGFPPPHKSNKIRDGMHPPAPPPPQEKKRKEKKLQRPTVKEMRATLPLSHQFYINLESARSPWR